MNKKLLLFVILPVAALVSFGGMFVTGWLTTSPPPEDDPNAPSPDVVASQQAQLTPTPMVTAQSAQAQEQARQRGMSERQLTELISEMQNKIQQYDQKIESLAAREEQLDVVAQSLKEDVKRLDAVRMEVANAVAGLKKQIQDLEAQRITIEQREQANLLVTAETWAKIDPTNVAKIILSYDKEAPDPITKKNEHMENAVKVLYLMDVKKRGPVLDALVLDDQAQLAANLSLKIKNIVVGNN